MSLSALNSIQNIGSLLISTSASSVTQAASTTLTSVTSTPNVSNAHSQSTLAKETAQLLKDLANGDVSAAQTDLVNLRKDLKAEESSSSSTESSFEKLLGKLSSALDSGNANDALDNLASYLVQSGNSSGNALNTSA